MKIKRFLAKDMRTAIRQVRQDQGPDAVILSNERVEGGIEIISATDYDEALIHQALGVGNQSRASEKTRDRQNTGALFEEEASHSKSEPSRTIAEESTVDAAVPASAGRTDMPPVQTNTPAESGNIWSQEPVLVGVKDEVSALRHLLECQLASLAWNDMSRRQPLRARSLRDLCELDIAPELAREISDSIPDIANKKDAWRMPLDHLLKRIPVSTDDILNRGGVVAVVGPTGVGKTTTVAKIAARYALKHGAENVALVSTDGYRIGAREQLLTYARILGVPMHVASTSQELSAVLENLVSKQMILIDTAGMSQRDVRLAGQFATLRAAGRGRIKVLLALNAACEISALREIVKVFGILKPAGLILTKVDEAASLGASLSVAIQNALPLTFVTDGQRVPEDIHAAHNKRLWLIQNAVKMRQKANRTVDEDYMAKHFGKVVSHA